MYRRKRHKTVLESGHLHHSPTEHSDGGKHYFCDATFLLFVGQGWRLQALYTHRLFPLPHRNWSWQLMFCAKARDYLINKTIATKKKKKRKEPPFLTKLYISLKHFLFLGQTMNTFCETGLIVRLQYQCILKRPLFHWQMPNNPWKYVGNWKTWKDCVYVFTETCTQITYVSVAPLVFPAAGQLPETEVLKHCEETCFQKISNRGL